jgi:hypothetical protein
MQSRREIFLNTAFILAKAQEGPVFVNDLEKRKHGNKFGVIYTVKHLVDRGLIRESIEKDMREIPRVALLLTEKGKALLRRIEGQSVAKHPNPAAAMLAIR